MHGRGEMVKTQLETEIPKSAIPWIYILRTGQCRCRFLFCLHRKNDSDFHNAMAIRKLIAQCGY